MNQFMILKLIAYALASASGLMLIKKSVSKLSSLNYQQIASILFSWNFSIGFMLYLGSFLYWLYLLSRYELSRIFPIVSGLVILFTVIFSIFFLREKLLLINVLGIGLMQVSIVMISYKSPV